MNFLNKVYTYKTTLTAFFFFEKQKSPFFYCLKGKIRMNKFAGGNFFVCACFFETKNIFSYTFDLSGQVGDKKFLTRPISGNKTTFFWPWIKNLDPLTLTEKLGPELRFSLLLTVKCLYGYTILCMLEVENPIEHL